MNSNGMDFSEMPVGLDFRWKPQRFVEQEMSGSKAGEDVGRSIIKMRIMT